MGKRCGGGEEYSPMKVLALHPIFGFLRQTRFWKVGRIAFLRQQLRYW